MTTTNQLVVLITVVDIQTNNAYSYGEGEGYDRRVFVIYDGVHYDGAKTKWSQTRFDGGTIVKSL